MFNSNSERSYGHNLTPAKLISIEQIISPLVNCYEKGGRILKELAIVALFNIGLSHEDFISTMYLDGIISYDKRDTLIFNLMTPHQSLLKKTLKCLLLVIKHDSVDLKEHVDGKKCDIIKRLLDLIQMKNIDIKIMTMKALFTFIKRQGKAAEDVFFKYDENIIDKIRDELADIHGEQYFDRKLNDDDQDGENKYEKIELTNVEKSYCKTILSLLCQISALNSKVNEKDDNNVKIKIGNKIMPPFIKMVYHQVLSDFIQLSYHKSTKDL